MITLLPKAGKLPKKCENLKPTSLLTSDIITKVFARRLQEILPKVIERAINQDNMPSKPALNLD